MFLFNNLDYTEMLAVSGEQWARRTGRRAVAAGRILDPDHRVVAHGRVRADHAVRAVLNLTNIFNYSIFYLLIF
jgi:hypothetical protein